MNDQPPAPGEPITADDFVSRLAFRLTTPAEVRPRLGLRFAPTPDLPDEDTVRWRLDWVDEAP
ncbi:MAG: hypothetical protein AAGM22_05270 [Acidobacteriota bacterium]